MPDGFHLLVGRNVGDLNQFMTKIHVALGMVIFLVFAIAAVASVAVTRRTVGRIESINATTHAIMQSGLGKRVPLRGTKDEWDQLAGNLNKMLDRIEALMAEVKQVTDNVAHDLRTPLTRLRGRLERASLGARDLNADQALINESMADLDDVLRMFASLTRISQVETSNRTAAFGSVDLVEIAQDVVELFDAAAEVKHVNLAVAGEQSFVIIGDRDLLSMHWPTSWTMQSSMAERVAACSWTSVGTRVKRSCRFATMDQESQNTNIKMCSGDFIAWREADARRAMVWV